MVEAPSIPAPEIVDGWLARLRDIPKDSRTFAFSVAEAEEHFGLGRGLLARLLEGGLVHRSVGGKPRFAFTDLHFVALRLRTAPSYLKALRHWARTLERLSSAVGTGVTVRYMPSVTDELRGREALVRLPDGSTRRVELGQHPTPAQFACTVPRGTRVTNRRIRAVLDRVDAFDFCVFPESLRGDAELARRTGLAECRTATSYVLEECRALGVEARRSHGVLLSIPFSTEHTWAEIRCGEDWVAVDPLLLRTLEQFVGLERSGWPPDRDVGAVLVRFGSESIPLVTLAADGARVTTVLLTAADGPAGA